MSTQPEALRLADELCAPVSDYPAPTSLEDAAARELRRLHEVEVAYGVMMKQAESRIAEQASDPAIHYCHRFAILMECVMLGGVDKHWDEMGTLLDEYHKARDAWAEAHGQPYVSGFGKD